MIDRRPPPGMFEYQTGNLLRLAWEKHRDRKRRRRERRAARRLRRRQRRHPEVTWITPDSYSTRPWRPERDT